jgi:adenylylsulfate kinase
MNGAVVWITGLPRAGKTTLATATRAALERCGVRAIVLDGDAVRAALHPRPGYDPGARADFYATLAHLAGLLAAQGFVVLVPATAHRRAFRDKARRLAPRFVEAHVVTPVEECAARDGGGLYTDASSRAQLPGAGLDYEEPLRPDVLAHGGRDARAVDHLLALLAPVIS